MATLDQILSAAPATATALRAPEKPALSYGDLRRFVAKLGGALRQCGVARADRVAIALPNGASMATAFLAVANACVAAPLNPAYTEDEFRFYMEDLGCALLLTDRTDNAAARAAAGLGIRVVLVAETAEAPAGLFSTDLPAGDSGLQDPAQPDDAALVLHTSGTTSRPKIVPLTQANIAASAGNVASSLQLSADDTCMNIMPLFHIHGLIAAVLATLKAGGSLYCTPGFNALKVFGWLQDADPTWYTAVPTMHQAILSRAQRNPDIVAAARLRLIRSSSASLPPQVMAALEDTFGCPVVEAYGMTEASHQMTVNPIASGAQKPGSVGRAAGIDLAILEGEQVVTQDGITGEVLIRGENVFAGYQANDKANAESFLPDPDGRGGWFRTGDQGWIDADGYLHLTGRLKEIINRGGEKISPREVDEVLMDHPAVNQAVTFAMPHDKLGEEVAAAVVLNDGHSAEGPELSRFVAERLAAFKVPRQVLILDEIPKGATGKLQRIGLHKKLGLGEAE